jgi:hypothetical protein
VSVMHSGTIFESYCMKFLSINSRKASSFWEYRW